MTVAKAKFELSNGEGLGLVKVELRHEITEQLGGIDLH